MSNHKESSFIKNAFILSAAAIISKILGAFYQAFLYQTVGSGGVGIYMKGINFYAMLLAISAAGIPIAISKLMAEERAAGRYDVANRIFTYSLKLLFFIGLVLSIGLFLFAPIIAKYIFVDSRTTYVLQAMAPALLVVTVMSAFRGYFQGKQQMLPTGISQVFEQIARVGFSVGITIYILKNFAGNNSLRIINGVAFGPFVGAILALIVLLIFFKNKGESIVLLKSNKKENLKILKRIILFAMPVTLAALLPTFLDVIEGIIIPIRLMATGFSLDAADRLYGSFSGAVLALVNLIVSTSSAFAISIVPAISAAIGRNDKKELARKVKLSIKMVNFISVPAGFGLLFLGQPILDLIFNASDAFNIMQFSFIMVLFIGLYHNTTGILQGMGKTFIPIISLSIGLLVNVVVLNLLISFNSLNILAAPIAYTLTYMVAFGINYLAIKRNINFKSDWQIWFPRVVLSGLVTGVVALMSYKLFFMIFNGLFGYSVSQLISLILCVLVAFVIYVIILVATRGISRNEAMAIPKFSKIVLKVFDKLKIEN
ncbi:MAG: stage V sporulation protein B [Fusobacteria bacterium]|nr:MAG: stage V sporulation protein B [Fusobacteriota bacterium]KAF0229705.1 MAG: stage V sporulation protein [Fusobacteriota bacterium]